MSTFNEKFWNNLHPAYYDISSHKGKLDNSIKSVWHYLTFLKQQKFLISKNNHLDYLKNHKRELVPKFLDFPYQFLMENMQIQNIILKIKNFLATLKISTYKRNLM